MRIGVISDIHSNLEAPSVVLRELEAQRVDETVCLGDVVGYGPDPNECCRLVRAARLETAIGNHDMAVAGRLDTDWFNYDARRAVEWTAKHID